MVVFRNFLLSAVHKERQEAVRQLFPELGNGDLPILSLHSYLSATPQKFFDRTAYRVYLDWLEDAHRVDLARLTNCFSDQRAGFERGIFDLSEINRYDWHDRTTGWDDYATLRFVGHQVHPAYLQLIEGAFRTFLFPIACLARQRRGVGTDGIDVFNIVDELEKTPLKILTRPYRHGIRNGIAHGGVTYTSHEITYRDKKGNQESASLSEMIRLFDDMIDVCNALALAFRVFHLRHFNDRPGVPMPSNILLEEVRAETLSPWWEIEGCLPSEINTGNQLLIYAKAETTDCLKVLYSAFHAAALCEHAMPGYSRYFVTLRSSMALPGFVAFNGLRLEAARIRNASEIEDYAGCIEDNQVFFFVPRFSFPRLLYRIAHFLQSFRLHWPVTLRQIQKNLDLPELKFREVEIHRNGWRSVVNARVYLRRNGGALDKHYVRRVRRGILRKAVREARRAAAWHDLAKYLPSGYVGVSIFETDHRRRRLGGYGLGPDLICRLKSNNISRIREPDLIDSTIEQVGRFRFAWNRAWLLKQDRLGLK